MPPWRRYHIRTPYRFTMEVKRVNALESGLKQVSHAVKAFEGHLHATVDLAAAEGYEKGSGQ